ncbi:Uncharacterized protein FWK35_00026175 [Aphis craccivora]|uniref:Uncharacterized protein n=1 Tax=Aphis craccivora TaxID=307492 RepID=A0A6G0VZ47_APHCR|nr:Uncharacterized protein FWK35_00026175 [Aphis craccivora]
MTDGSHFVRRYYDLRRRIPTKINNFFITNRGQRLIKIYDEINIIYGSRLSANIFRRMVESMARVHDQRTSSGVAKALQHSEDTALRYYQVPDTSEAIRRQSNIDTVDQTAAFEANVLDEFDNLFPAQPYSNVNEKSALDKLLSSGAYSANPTAKVSSTFVQKYVLDARIDILVQMLANDYDAQNISRIAVIDCTKRNKLHYFLHYEKEKLIKNVTLKIKKIKK